MAFKEAAIGLSLAQSVFDRPWFVGRPIERQRHSTPTEARTSTDSLSYRETNWFPARLLSERIDPSSEEWEVEW